MPFFSLFMPFFKESSFFAHFKKKLKPFFWSMGLAQILTDMQSTQTSNTPSGSTPLQRMGCLDGSGVPGDRHLKPSEPSLCIPMVFPNITEARILAIFRELNLGEVDHLDIVERQGKDGRTYNRVFVHFKSWNEEHNEMRTKLIQDESFRFKIIYDDPWFWLIGANRASKHAARPRPKLVVD